MEFLFRCRKTRDTVLFMKGRRMKRRNREGDGSDSMENTIRNTGSLEDKNDVGYGSTYSPYECILN